MALAPASTVALFVLSVTITACVLVLNVLSIVGIVRTRGVRVSHSNMFILNLAIVDILMMAPQLFFATSALRGVITPIGLILSAAGFFTLTTAAMLNTFAIAVDRFLFIKRAMTYPSIVTSERVRAMVVFIWIMAIFLGTISLYDLPFDQIADEGFLQIHPNCQNTTVQWLQESRSSLKYDNLSIYNRRVGFREEADITLLLHQIAACPQAARPALRIQNMILFVLFCLMGAVSVVLYAQAFFVIREHNRTLATHSNFGAGSVSDDNVVPGCKICSRWGDSDQRSNSLSSRQAHLVAEGRGGVNARGCGVKKLSSKSSLFDTSSLCLGALRRDRGTSSSRDIKRDGQITPSSSSAAGSSSNRLSQNSTGTSTVSLHLVSNSFSKNSDQKTSENSFDSADVNGYRREETPAESKPTLSLRCSERRKRLRVSMRHRFQDMRTVKTLVTMFVIYYICWLPMTICNFTLYGLLHPITEQAFLGAWVLGTSNSVWNFLVYPMRNRELRTAIKHLVCIRLTSRGNN